MNYIRSIDQAKTEWDSALNTMLITLKKKQTQRNRYILDCYWNEFKIDKDYKKDSAEDLLRFFEDRDIRKVLD